MVIKKNKEYTIYENGKIEYGNLLPLLPKEYKQVEYIESTGTQYIDTKIPLDFISSLDVNFKLRFAITTLNKTYILAGAYDNFKQIVYFEGKMRADWARHDYLPSFETVIEKDKIYDIYQENGKLLFENSSFDIQTTSNSNLHFGLFARILSNENQSASSFSKMRLYEFEVEK